MIQEKLRKIQLQLKAPKSQYNSFGKYYFRNCEDILEVAKPIVAAEMCVLTVNDTVKQIGERYYIEAAATLTDTEDAASVTVTAYAREDENRKGMDASQLTGATSSYARKYALSGLFAIDDTKDADTLNNGLAAGAEIPNDTNIKRFVCEQCGTVIKPYINDRNENVNVRQHCESSKKYFSGHVYCRDCAKAKLKAGSNENTDR